MTSEELLTITFDQFKKHPGSCRWFRWDSFRMVSECNKIQYYIKQDEHDLNFCSKCGNPVVIVKRW